MNKTDEQLIWEAYNPIEINWDRTGIGGTPNQIDISYFGFTLNMNYEQFRRLVPAGNSNPETIKYIEQEIKNDARIAPPFLIAEWNDRGYWRVIDHEGRSRADAAHNLGIDIFPVDIIPQSMRARNITPEMKSAPFLKQKA